MFKDIYFRDFQELKRNAFAIALWMDSNGLDDNWLEHYIAQYAPSSHVWQYEGVIKNYYQYQTSQITEENAVKEIEKIRQDYEDMEQMLEGTIGKIIPFHIAAKKAFKSENKRYGEVAFECPICLGDAYANRFQTPNNPAHKVAYRFWCNKCDFSVMN